MPFDKRNYLGRFCCKKFEKSENLKDHALTLVDYYSVIYFIRVIDRVLNDPKDLYFHSFTIHCIKIKHLLTKFLGR